MQRIWGRRTQPREQPASRKRKAMDALDQADYQIQKYIQEENPDQNDLEQGIWRRAVRPAESIQQHLVDSGRNPTSKWATDREKDFTSRTHRNATVFAMIERRDSRPWKGFVGRYSKGFAIGWLGLLFDALHRGLFIGSINGNGRFIPANGYTLEDLRKITVDDAWDLAIALRPYEYLPTGVAENILVLHVDKYYPKAFHGPSDKWSVFKLSKSESVEHDDSFTVLSGDLSHQSRVDVCKEIAQYERTLQEERQAAIPAEFRIFADSIDDEERAMLRAAKKPKFYPYAESSWTEGVCARYRSLPETPVFPIDIDVPANRAIADGWWFKYENDLKQALTQTEKLIVTPQAHLDKEKRLRDIKEDLERKRCKNCDRIGLCHCSASNKERGFATQAASAINKVTFKEDVAKNRAQTRAEDAPGAASTTNEQGPTAPLNPGICDDNGNVLPGMNEFWTTTEDP